MSEGAADLHVHSWDVEDGGLQVVGFGLQGRRTFLPSEEMGGGRVGGLKLFLLGGRLLIQTPEAALAAPGAQGDKRAEFETTDRVDVQFRPKTAGATTCNGTFQQQSGSLRLRAAKAH